MELLIMAAGMGSRFGGLKQITPMGPNEEFIIDYSIYDAKKAGFNKVVFIIKEENYETFKETIGKRIEPYITVEYAFQKMENVPDFVKIPEDRTKPWGTAHAIYCAKDKITDKFLVINADDFYGRNAYMVAKNFLETAKEREYSTIAYKVKNTITDNGAVKRGVIHKDDNNTIKSIIECSVERKNEVILAQPLGQDQKYTLDEDQLVSMNILTFDPSIFPYLENKLTEFFHKNENNLSSCEYLIGDVLSDANKDGYANAKVLTTDATWYGVTYKEDAIYVKDAIHKLVNSGEYPIRLWSEKNKDLVIMAAGMGSRFGGLKQITPVGPNGEFIIDYSIYDAKQAGFNRVIIITKKELFEDFKETIGKRLEKYIDVEYAFQDINDVPDFVQIPKERKKPWGTGHALYSARNIATHPFAIITADDFYGREAFIDLSNALEKENEFAIISYEVGKTLSNAGTTKRAVCYEQNGEFDKLVESEISIENDKIYATPLNGGEKVEISKEQAVSMALFALQPNIFSFIKTDIVEFFRNAKDLEKVLDIFYNSGNFPKTIEFLFKLPTAPNSEREQKSTSKPNSMPKLTPTSFSFFEFFSDLTRYFRAQGIFEKEHRETEYFGFLWNFLRNDCTDNGEKACSNGENDGDTNCIDSASSDILRETLRFDFVSAQKTSSFPDWYEHHYDKNAHHSALKAHTDMHSTRECYAHSEYETFDFDMETFLPAERDFLGENTLPSGNSSLSENTSPSKNTSPRDSRKKVAYLFLYDSVKGKTKNRRWIKLDEPGLN